ncbi:MAG: diguanylate cyclase [Anaerolineaceae bacterium]|nr:diguanylate cyclase [Anaerolineaceae bacterium]
MQQIFPNEIWLKLSGVIFVISLNAMMLFFSSINRKKLSAFNYVIMAYSLMGIIHYLLYFNLPEWMHLSHFIVAIAIGVYCIDQIWQLYSETQTLYTLLMAVGILISIFSTLFDIYQDGWMTVHKLGISDYAYPIMIVLLAYSFFKQVLESLIREQSYKRANEELRAARDMLEEQIKERTAELTAEIENRKSLEMDLRESQEEYRKLSNVDPLTQLLNRRHFYEASSNEIHRARRYQHPLSLLMIDIDHFKKVNDQFGHAVGDRVLIEFSRLLLENSREMDRVCRYGGEEFAILLPHTSNENAWAFSTRLLNRIRQLRIIVDGEPLNTTASIGLTTLRENVNGLDDLLNEADQALYRAKDMGRNRVVNRLDMVINIANESL